MSTTIRRNAASAVARADDEFVLELASASRVFGAVRALAPLSLTLRPGTVCAVEGANGSGKTTLLRLAAGVLAPSSGRRSVDGAALYLKAGDGVRSSQTVADAVAFAARAAGRRDHDTASQDALASCGLATLAPTRGAALSSGQRARVSLAVALAAQPALLCLDEPTNHLDADGRLVVAAMVARLSSSGSAVLVATHDVAAFDGVLDARLRLDAGRVLTVA